LLLLAALATEFRSEVCLTRRIYSEHGTHQPQSPLIRLLVLVLAYFPVLDIRGASSMHTLKTICLFFFLLSLVSVIEGGLAIHPSPFRSMSLSHGVFGTTVSILDAVFWACAFYGIHKRAPIAWNLGWAVIVVGLLEFLIFGLSSTMRLPQADNPWIASAAVVVVGGAVATYWSIWWKRQKGYFVRRSS
jgi:hypothetical protein